MPKFRKKPVIIEAIQFTGKNCFEIFKFIGNHEALDCDMIHTTDNPVIQTLEGNMECKPGDWVIRGVNGEYYPCKPDIFDKTYDTI